MNKSEIAERAREFRESKQREQNVGGFVPPHDAGFWSDKLVAEFVERAIAESQAPPNERICICELPDYEGQPKLNGGWDKECPIHGELNRELGDGEPSPAKFKAALELIENYDSSCECDDHTQPECCANVSVSDCFCAHCIAGKALL